MIEKGYYVIRMGRYVEKKVNINHKQFIDYPFHELQSDFLDIYLSSHCQFFISVGSGIDAIPSIFQVPILRVNLPTHNILQEYGSTPWRLVIPKKVMNSKIQTLVTYKHAYEKECYFKKSHEINGGIPPHLQMEASGYIQIENSPQEISEAVKEMIDRLEGKVIHDELELQEKFWHSLGITRKPFEMLVCNRFLLDNQKLLCSDENRRVYC